MARKFILIRGLLITLASVVILSIVGGLAFYFMTKKRVPKPGQVFESLGNEHVRELASPHKPYNSVPPTSGPHLPRIAPWGIATVQVPDELIVHNLEDGGIVISYDPVRLDGPSIEKLKGIMGKYDDQILLHPYTKPPLEKSIALTAWTRLLTLDSVDEGKIIEFITAYRSIDHHEQK